MKFDKTLFDVKSSGQVKDPSLVNDSPAEKEVTPLERLRNLEEKISGAIERVKTLKTENKALEQRIRALEEILEQKDEEIRTLQSEKVTIKGQIEELLNELETIQQG